MSQGDILTVLKDAIMTALLMSAPFLIISLVIGIVVSVFQAATQIHEQNVVFVPKIIATGLILIFFGSWLFNTIINFTTRIFTNINTFL